MRQRWLRLWTFLRRDRAERELTRELDAHVRLIEDDLVRRGMAPADAALAARRALGGADQVRERHRDARSVAWLEDLRHDLGHSLRALSRTPLFAAAVVGTLALGVGASTAIFSVIDALLLKPLPYADGGDNLVRLIAHTPPPPGSDAPPRRGDVGFTAEELDALGRLRYIDRLGIVGSSVMNVRGVDGAGAVTVGTISSAAWRLLGEEPAIGRLPLPLADGAGEVVLSHIAWQRYFAGAPDVLGRSLTVDTVLGRRTSRQLVVVGVMPASFAFPRPETLFWTAPPLAVGGGVAYRGRMIARLAPGATMDAALAEMAPRVRAIRQHAAEIRYELVKERDELVGPVRPAALVLAAAVAVLLLLACLNVANLLLARTIARRREFSVRAAVGASQSRLARQALTESALLGVAGGAAGLVVARGTLEGFRALATTLPRIDLTSSGPGWGGSSFPRLDDVTLDGRVLVFAVVLAVGCGLVTGVAAALRASRADVFGAFRATGTATAGGRRATGARRLLVVTQVACAMTLLVLAVLLGRSLQQLTAAPTGYATSNVLTFQVGLPATTYPDDRVLTFADAVTERLRALPGVDVAAYANQIPMVQLRDTAGGVWTTPDATRTFAPDAADARLVSRDYLRAFGVRIVAGRGFDVRDDDGQPRVLLVNETLARRQFPNGDAVGRTLFVGRDVAPWTVVGIAADVRQFGLDKSPEPQFFVDLRQWQRGMPIFPAGAYYVIRGQATSAAMAPELTRLVRTVEPEAIVFNVTPMDTIVGSSVARPRLYASLVGLFAVIGALLAAIGLYGVLSFVVHERTAEIGIRLALGATRGDIVRMVAREGGALVAGGVVAGSAGALALARGVETLLYGVAPNDPRVFVAAAGLFGVIAGVAILVPARRAMRADPLQAIRCE